MSNLHFNNGTFISNKFVEKIQTSQSIRLSVKTDIAEVLSVGVESVVTSYDVAQGEATLFGKTNVKFVYTDGANLSGANYNADFTSSVQNELLTADSKLTFDVVVVDTKVDTTANTATLTVLLEISVCAFVADSCPYLAGGDDLFTQTQQIQTAQVVQVANLPLVVEQQLTSSQDISTVLLAESALCLTQSTFSGGILRLSGEGAVRLTYLSGGKIVTDSLPFAFNEELDGAMLPVDSVVTPTLCVKNTKVRLNIAEGEINTDFTVEIAANVVVEATTVGVLDVVTDAYALNGDFVFTRKAVTTTLPCGGAVATKQTVATMPGGGKTPLSAVNVGAVVTKCIPADGQVAVQGVVFATALYQGETGTESELVELPFAHTLPLEKVTTNSNVRAKACVLGFDLQGESLLTATATLSICLQSSVDVTHNVIVAAQEQPFDKTNVPAIEVCIAAKGETLWELAKGLHMSETDLVMLNPQITNPLQKDTQIVVFNKI